MLPFLAPFGQAENQMFEMKEGQRYRKNECKRCARLDAATNLNPHNVMASSSIRNVKGFNAQLARHSGTVDSAYNNIVHEDYHRGRRTGDRELADIAHQRLEGKGNSSYDNSSLQSTEEVRSVTKGCSLILHIVVTW